MTDWMEGAEFAGAQELKERDEQKALEFAALYLVFDTEGPAKTLLKHWVETVEQRDITPSATHQEYAYWEGRRAFIRGIQRQIEFARTRGRPELKLPEILAKR